MWEFFIKGKAPYKSEGKYYTVRIPIVTLILMRSEEKSVIRVAGVMMKAVSQTELYLFWWPEECWVWERNSSGFCLGGSYFCELH